MLAVSAVLVVSAEFAGGRLLGEASMARKRLASKQRSIVRNLPLTAPDEAGEVMLSSALTPRSLPPSAASGARLAPRWARFLLISRCLFRPFEASCFTLTQGDGLE